MVRKIASTNSPGKGIVTVIKKIGGWFRCLETFNAMKKNVYAIESFSYEPECSFRVGMPII
ncbi:hypothetical protein GZ78_19040 [Endozoicomonas numazuensis]|uniref:Uncharacterized protein n=1 Tax=Endozoicomonas numazuensis TaxID=1137799 RepID=A0A081NEA6_9GAMM|nr:hypothetical protein GZ78_19040 [Endozoicomonas numazuensis]